VASLRISSRYVGLAEKCGPEGPIEFTWPYHIKKPAKLLDPNRTQGSPGCCGSARNAPRQLPANSMDEATNEAKRHAIRPRNIDSTSLLLASGVQKSIFMLVRILSCLALLNAAVMAAQPGFLLGRTIANGFTPMQARCRSLPMVPGRSTFYRSFRVPLSVLNLFSG